VFTHLLPEDVVQACTGKKLALLFESHDIGGGRSVTVGMLVAVEEPPMPVKGGPEDGKPEVIACHWVACSIIRSIDSVRQQILEVGCKIKLKEQAVGEKPLRAQVWCID